MFDNEIPVIMQWCVTSLSTSRPCNATLVMALSALLRHARHQTLAHAALTDALITLQNSLVAKSTTTTTTNNSLFIATTQLLSVSAALELRDIAPLQALFATTLDSSHDIIRQLARCSIHRFARYTRIAHAVAQLVPPARVDDVARHIQRNPVPILSARRIITIINALLVEWRVMITSATISSSSTSTSSSSVIAARLAPLLEIVRTMPTRDTLMQLRAAIDNELRY